MNASDVTISSSIAGAFGGGLVVMDSGRSYLYRCHLYNNSAVSYGGNIYVDDGTLIAYDTEVYNGVTNFGGGIFISNAASVQLFNCSVYNSTADVGGLIFVNDRALLQCIGSDLHHGVAVTGACLSVSDDQSVINITETTVSHCVISTESENDGQGGAVRLLFNGSFIMSSSVLSECESYQGGCIHSDVGNVIIDNSVITRCRARTGGCLFLTGTKFSMNDSEVSHCEAAFDGGAITLSYSNDTATFTRCIIHDNRANKGGTFAIFNVPTVIQQCTVNASTSKTLGGIIYAIGERDVTVVDSQLSDGDAYEGGCMFLGYGAHSTVTHSVLSRCSAQIRGGALSVNDAFLVLNNSDIVNSTADKGGAVYANDGGDVVLIHSTMRECRAQYGGCMMLDGEVDGVTAAVSYSTVSLCQAEIGSALYLVNGAYLHTEHVDIIYNNATSYGAAYVSASTVNATDTHFNNNYGVGLYSESSSVVLLDCNTTVCRNIPYQYNISSDCDLRGNGQLCGTITRVDVHVDGRYDVYPGTSVLVDGDDMLLTDDYFVSADIVKVNTSSLPLTFVLIERDDVLIGPLTLTTARGRVSQSFESYRFMAFNSSSCPVSVTSPPSPSYICVNISVNITVSLSIGCERRPNVSCIFTHDGISTRVGAVLFDDNNVTCPAPLLSTPQTVSVVIEISYPGYVFNITSHDNMILYYPMASPIGGSQLIATDGHSVITLAHVPYYTWAVPRCVYRMSNGSLVYQTAVYINKLALVRCVFRSDTPCSYRLDNHVYVSLYGEQPSVDSVIVKHVCAPIISRDVMPTPPYALVNTTDQYIAVPGAEFYSTADDTRVGLCCKFGSDSTTAFYYGTGNLNCPAPNRTTEGRVMLQVSNDCNYFVNVSIIDFLIDTQICDAGHWRMGLDCVPCEIGTYKPSRNGDKCSNCGDGMTTNSTGATSIDHCHCNRANSVPDSNHSACVCGRGFYLNGGKCDQCGQGQYKEVESNGACSICPRLRTNDIYGAISESQCVCIDEYYAPNYHNGTAMTCVPCRAGAHCVNGSDPISDNGFYGNGNHGDVFIECLPREACLQGSVCKKGYVGDMCASCDNGWYRSQSKCLECSRTSAWPTIIGLCAGAVIVVIYLFSEAMKGPSSSMRLAAITIGYAFLQIFALVGSVSSGDQVSEPFATLFRSTSSINLNLQILALECVHSNYTFFDYLALKLMTPGLLVMIVAMVAAVSMLIIERAMRARVLTAAVSTSVLLMTMMYVIVTSSVLSYVTCSKTINNDVWVLDASPDIECFGTEHLNNLHMFIIGLLLYVICIPAGLYYIIVSMRVSTSRMSNDTYNQCFGFLSAKYRDDVYWWELVVMVRKALLVIAFTLWSRTIIVKIMMAVLILICALYVQNLMRPMANRMVDRLESVTLLFNVLLLTAGLAVFAVPYDGEGDDERDKSLTHALFIIFVICCMAIIVYVVVVVLRCDTQHVSKKKTLIEIEEEEEHDGSYTALT